MIGRALPRALFGLGLVALAVASPASGETRVEAEIRAGERLAYPVEICPGCSLRVEAEQIDVDLVLELSAPATGRTLRLDSPSGRRGEERGLWTAAAGETEVSVVLEAGPGAGSGRFRLRTEVLAPGQLAPEKLTQETAWTAASAAYLGGTERAAALEGLLASLPSPTQPGRRAQALSLAAELARAEHRNDQARELLEASLPLWRQAGDADGEAQALSSFGFLIWRSGEVEEALALYAQALELATSTTNSHAAAQILNNLGHAHLYRGEAAEADTYFRRGVEAAREARSPRLRARLLNNLGGVHQTLGETAEALDFFDRARQLHEDLGDEIEAARALSNLGAVHRTQGDYRQALEHYLEARRRFVASGHPAGEATTLNSIGSAYLSLGETERAAAFLQQALPLRRQVGDRRGEAVTLHNLGRAAQAREAWDEARDLFAQALELRREVKSVRGEATTLDHLGSLEVARGRPEAALPHLRRALEIRRSLGDPRRVAVTLRHLGEALLAAGRPEEALVPLGEAVAARLGPGESQERAAALHARGEAHLAAGRVARAAADLDLALALLESEPPRIPAPDLEASFRAGYQSTYGLAIDIAMARHGAEPGAGHHRQALELSERARARGLIALLSAAEVEIRQGVDPDLLAQRRAFAERLAAKAAARRRRPATGDELGSRLDAEILDLLARGETLEGEIRRQSEAYADLRRPRALSTAELQALLGPDTLLAEYWLGDRASYLWAVTEEEIRVHTLPPRGELAEDVRSLLKSWSTQVVGRRSVPEVQRIADLLLAPISEGLGERRLVVVADGALHYLPFGALPRPSGGGPLLADREVTYLPAAAALPGLRRSRRSTTEEPPSLIVLADPNLAAGGAAGASLAPLPHSRAEAEAIAALLPAERRRLALGDEASRELVIGGALEDHALIHIATHGFLDASHPSLSGLALAGGGRGGTGRPGFLGLHDVYNLRLSAELVVLSGCQTALGREIRGEGLVGLTRGFLSAGARRVVASLWPVQDRATAELMAAFYRALLVDGEPPAAALRSARLSLRSRLRWRDPYFWAGFVLVGDWAAPHWAAPDWVAPDRTEATSTGADTAETSGE